LIETILARALNLEIAKPTTSKPVDIDRLNDSGGRAQQLKP
jgi:hypothetical protein